MPQIVVALAALGKPKEKWFALGLTEAHPSNR